MSPGRAGACEAGGLVADGHRAVEDRRDFVGDGGGAFVGRLGDGDAEDRFVNGVGAGDAGLDGKSIAVFVGEAARSRRPAATSP